MANTNLVKVTMNLTEKDVENTERLTAILDHRSKASTVSTALSLARFVTDNIIKGNEIMIKKKDGTKEVIHIMGLNG